MPRGHVYGVDTKGTPGPRRACLYCLTCLEGGGKDVFYGYTLELARKAHEEYVTARQAGAPTATLDQEEEGAS